MKLSTMIILVILLVTYYFWHAKLQEIATSIYEANKDSDVVRYSTGIWNNMKNIQKVQDSKTQRALELVGERKKITEKSGLYSLSVPENWNKKFEQGLSGNQISSMTMESLDFLKHQEGNNIFYDNGVQLVVQVVRGEQQAAKETGGGHGKMLIRSAGTDFEGNRIEYHLIKDVLVKSGEIMDAHTIHGGNTYNFRLVYNPQSFSGAEYSFQEILNSFKFGDKR